MYNMNIDKYLPPSQTATEIAKDIKQSFSGACRPVYDAEKKVRQRTDTKLLYVRDEDEWMKTLERRGKQKTQGFFSLLAQPYDELGTTELVAKDLVKKAMDEIGVIFKSGDCPTSPYEKTDSKKNELPKNKQEMKNHKKESSPSKLLNSSNEALDDGSSTIKDLLDKAEKRIKNIKAGQPLSQCLQDECKGDARNFSKGPKGKQKEIQEECSVISLQSPDQFVEEEDSTDDLTRHKRQQENKFRKAFLAKLECLEAIFHCVLNAKNKDLRSKVPLSREALRIIRSADVFDGPQGIMGGNRLPRMSAIPAVIFASNRNHRLPSFALNETDLMPATHLHHNSNITYTDDVNSAGSRMHLNATDAVSKAAAASIQASRNWVHLSASRTSQPYFGTGSFRMETWEDFLAIQSDSIKCDNSVADVDGVKSLKTGQPNFSRVSRLLKPRRGAVFQSRGNLDLPIWQRVIQDEMKREDAKSGRKVKDFAKKKVVNGEVMLKEVKAAFKKTKHKSLDKFERELETKINCFKERMNSLRISLLPDEDLKYMRRMVNSCQEESSGEKVRPVKWFEALSDEQKSLSLHHDVEINSKLKSIMRFTKLEATSISNLKAKLCLLVMSFPVYDLCQNSMQEAIKFFLSSIMEISPNYLEDWMLNRKLFIMSPSAK